MRLQGLTNRACNLTRGCKRLERGLGTGLCKYQTTFDHTRVLGGAGVRHAQAGMLFE